MAFLSSAKNHLNGEQIPTAAAMDAEIRLVARLHSLTLWRIILTVILLIFEFMRTIYHLRILSAIYILLTANLLPTLLEPLCAPHVRKSTPVLPFLRKRYHYSSLSYTTAELSFLITDILIILWQFNNSTPAYPAAWLYKFPGLLLAASLFWRSAAPALLSARIRKNMGV